MKEWGRVAGMHGDTMRKRVLAATGKDFKHGEMVPASVILKAVQPTDIKAEQTRETKERADKLELANAEKRRELFPQEEVEKMIHLRFQLLLDLFRSLPTEVAGKCNPSDPEHAYRVLDEFLQGRLPILRESGQVTPDGSLAKRKRKKK